MSRVYIYAIYRVYVAYTLYRVYKAYRVNIGYVTGASPV
jgi:hypothetical protein